MLTPVEDNTDLARTSRGNVVNTNKMALEQAKKRKQQINKIDKIDKLEKDVEEIKSMLLELINK